MRIRPYDSTKPYRARTAAQNEQFRLARVRGLWFHAFTLTGTRRTAMQDVIDAELAACGQETQTDRVARQRELAAKLREEHQ